jgi:hypothetical protein
MYKYINLISVRRISDGAVIPIADGNTDYEECKCWLALGNTLFPADIPAVKTQAQLDYDRYIKRSQAKDKILSEFAAENMGRIRAGTWTVPNLIALTQDTQLTTLLSNINTLSFELAIVSVQGLTNPLITPEIKASWIAKLQANLFLNP